ncbi:BnaA02g06770D [Brassica napus]|uniref:BnaA02g06770D protein n=1 Tax=Brassica napus TaxID=3708 RepID=A0A078F787_BRANA|nr:BnaA02g06770D [Brassica napus]
MTSIFGPTILVLLAHPIIRSNFLLRRKITLFRSSSRLSNRGYTKEGSLNRKCHMKAKASGFSRTMRMQTRKKTLCMFITIHQETMQSVLTLGLTTPLLALRPSLTRSKPLPKCKVFLYGKPHPCFNPSQTSSWIGFSALRCLDPFCLGTEIVEQSPRAIWKTGLWSCLYLTALRLLEAVLVVVMEEVESFKLVVSRRR